MNIDEITDGATTNGGLDAQRPASESELAGARDHVRVIAEPAAKLHG
jgi:hypothetical protein